MKSGVLLTALVILSTIPSHTRSEEEEERDILSLEDYYDILGIERSAEAKDIKKAFRKLSKKYHPDRSKDPQANDKFAAIGEAYDVLSDKNKRKKYDRYGKDGLKEDGRGGGRGSWSDFFGEDDDGGFFGGRRGGQRKPRPIVVEFFVSLEMIIGGGKVDYSYFSTFECPHCNGSGADNPNDIETCSECKGRGQVIKVRQLAPGYIQQMQMQCPKCGGKGKIHSSVCHVCSGEKLTKGVKEDFVWVEKGMPDGEIMTIENGAHEQDDGQKTGLKLIIRHAPHAFYRKRDSVNLECTVELTLREALMGFNKQIRYLDGEYIDVRGRGVTQPGSEMVIVKKGLPVHNSGGDYGSLYVMFKVLMPEQKRIEAKRDQWKAFFA